MCQAALMQALESSMGARDKARTEFQEAEATVQEAYEELEAVFRPICERAVARYNASAILRIEPGFEIAFNPKKSCLFLGVRLKYPSGNEPDEDFDGKDVESITALFLPHIESELSAAHASVEFGGFSVPSSYYMK